MKNSAAPSRRIAVSGDNTRPRMVALCLMLAVWLSLAPVTAQESHAATAPAHDADPLYTPAVAAAVDDAMRYLTNQQQKSGAIGKNAQIATTALSGLALLSAGQTPGRGKYAQTVKNCVNFLMANQRANGYFCSDFDQQSRMHGQGFALLFLAEVYGMLSPGPRQDDAELAKLQDSIKRAITVCEESQSPEGGWNYEPSQHNVGHEGSITVCIVEGLRAARNAGFLVKRECIDNAVSYMKKSWDGTSSFQYRLGQPGLPSFPLAGAGACVLIATGDQSVEVQKMIRSAVEFVRSCPPGTANDAAIRFWFYGYFYATQALHFQGGEAWERWYVPLRDVLLARRKVSAGLGGYWEASSNEVGGDTAFGTALAVLMLQMPSQYLSVFQR